MTKAVEKLFTNPPDNIDNVVIFFILVKLKAWASYFEKKWTPSPVSLFCEIFESIFNP